MDKAIGAGPVVLSAEEREEPQGLLARWRTLLALAFGYFIDQGEARRCLSSFPRCRRYGVSITASWASSAPSATSCRRCQRPFGATPPTATRAKRIIVLGTGLWGIWTLLVGLSESYSQLLVLRAISGIGLGCLMPATFSLISDTFAPQRRGRALGILEAIGVLGIIAGTLALGQLASPQLWRW